MGDAGVGCKGYFWRKGVKLLDKHRSKIAFVVLRESVNGSRSIWDASAEHRWSIQGACKEHARSIQGLFRGAWGGVMVVGRVL